jgi:hypothetical protein
MRSTTCRHFTLAILCATLTCVKLTGSADAWVMRGAKHAPQNRRLQDATSYAVLFFLNRDLVDPPGATAGTSPHRSAVYL